MFNEKRMKLHFFAKNVEIALKLCQLVIEFISGGGRNID
jgi:hypothetical protein